MGSGCVYVCYTKGRRQASYPDQRPQWERAGLLTCRAEVTLGCHWVGSSVTTTTDLRLRWPTAEINLRKVTPQSMFQKTHHGHVQLKEGKLRHTAGSHSEAQRPEFPPLQSVIPTRWLTPAPPPPCSNTWYVLNTLSGSQHVFSLQFFISNIHLGFGLLSNAMWMESRCLFWTQQNKRRVTEPILPQSKLVLTTTPTVGDRLRGTGPMLI